MSVKKQTSEVFEILSKGLFICSNSTDNSIRKLYDYLEQEYDKLYDYFFEINFILERGDEYFYFSKNESKVNLERKLETAFKWIDVVDFFKTYEDSFGPGFRFTPSDISVRLDVDAVLKTKLAHLKKYTQKDKLSESIQKLIEILCKAGYAELESEISDSYKILSSFSYLEELVMSINIPEETQNEIPE